MAGLFLSVGAGPGIGLSTAKRFALEGFDVVLAARDARRLEAMADELRSTTEASVTVEIVDCTDGPQVAALVDRYSDRLDVLHYNAAVLRAQTLQRQDIDTISSDIEVDISSGLVAARQAALAMASRGRGTILFTGGKLGVVPTNSYLTLSVGKAGLRAAAQALFPDLAAQGIHCAILTIGAGIAPGTKSADAVGEAFWQLHAQPRTSWKWEASFP